MTDFSDLPDVDMTVPNAARMYDYFLGGSHNFAADRAAADRTKAATPWVVDAIRANRAFLFRAVRYCLDQGVDQFLDLGSGIPTVGNVHEIARETDPSARVAYVDNEPVAVMTSESVLEGDALATVTHEDLRNVEAVLAAPTVTDLIDFTRPVALRTLGVLHFLPDSDDPADVLRRYRSHLVPGSLHVLSHGTTDHAPQSAAGVASSYARTSNPARARNRDEVLALLQGLELAEPGLVDASQWRPDDPDAKDMAGYYAAIGRIG